MDNSVELQLLKETLQEIKERYKDLEKRVAKVETSREKTEFQYQEIIKSLDKLNEVTIPNLRLEIEGLKNKPAKRWETGVNAVISGIVAVVVSFLFKNFK